MGLFYKRLVLFGLLIFTVTSSFLGCTKELTAELESNLAFNYDALRSLYVGQSVRLDTLLRGVPPAAKILYELSNAIKGVNLDPKTGKVTITSDATAAVKFSVDISHESTVLYKKQKISATLYIAKWPFRINLKDPLKPETRYLTIPTIAQRKASVDLGSYINNVPSDASVRYVIKRGSSSGISISTSFL